MGSKEKAIECVTGVNRQGIILPPRHLAQPTMPLALEFRTLQIWVRQVEKEAPAWVQSAQEQGRRAAAGHELDPTFVQQRAAALELVTDRNALPAMVRRAKYKKAAGAARADRRPSRAKR